MNQLVAQITDRKLLIFTQGFQYSLRSRGISKSRLLALLNTRRGFRGYRLTLNAKRISWLQAPLEREKFATGSL